MSLVPRTLLPEKGEARPLALKAPTSLSVIIHADDGAACPLSSFSCTFSHPIFSSILRRNKIPHEGRIFYRSHYFMTHETFSGLEGQEDAVRTVEAGHGVGMLEF